MKQVKDMSISEVINTSEFALNIKKNLHYKDILKRRGIATDEAIIEEYRRCMDRVSTLSASTRMMIIELGNSAFFKTMRKFQDNERRMD